MVRRKRYKTGLILGLLIALISGCGAAETGVTDSKARVEPVEETVDVHGECKVHFLDVGQADSILIQVGEEAMLVDAGKNEDGEAVVSYIKNQGVERLSYVIGTHPHEDHIGGLDTVIENLEVEEVILPEKIHTTKTFEDVLNAVDSKGLGITLAKPGDVYKLGEAEFTVVAPNADYGNNLNSWSVGIRFVYGNNSFLMTGDAERDAEQDMLDTGLELQADVWKASHHGSVTSNSREIMDVMQPTWAVISSGVGNSYGHPHREVLEDFKRRGITVFRTDEQGTIVATSDGTNITWNVEPAAVGQGPANGKMIVHVTKSGKRYHLEGCDGLRNSDIEMTLEEAKERGFTPCKGCNPPE